MKTSTQKKLKGTAVRSPRPASQTATAGRTRGGDGNDENPPEEVEETEENEGEEEEKVEE